MSRKPMVAGNWKMHKTAGEGVILVQNVENKVAGLWDDVEIGGDVSRRAVLLFVERQLEFLTCARRIGTRPLDGH